MSNWEEFADELRNDSVLAALTENQVEAAIDVLALSICADGSVGFLEKLELERQLAMLPWFTSKSGLLKSRIAGSLEYATGIDDEASFREVAEKAATKLGDPHVRRKIYEMAATLACADHYLHRKEKRALLWLADTFGISEADADALLERIKEEHL